jgi:hypothetical protein
MQNGAVDMSMSIVGMCHVVRCEWGLNGRECTAGWRVGVRVSRRPEDREYVKVNVRDERELQVGRLAWRDRNWDGEIDGENGEID